MVDTRDLKSLEGNFVPVQVRLWAPSYLFFMINFLNLSSEKPYIIFKSLYQKAIENGQKGIEAISVSSYNQPLKEVEARLGFLSRVGLGY